MQFEIQYASDLHLEVLPPTTPFSEILTPVAPLLILAGDICPVSNPVYADFLRWCSRGWKHVLVISGNHEYFCEVPQNIPDIDTEIDRILYTLPNVQYLNPCETSRETVVFKGIRFLGATLWSNIDKRIWTSPTILKKGEFTHTYLNGRPSTPEYLTQLHEFHRARLAYWIQRSKEPVVVITHHMPSYALVSPEYKATESVSCYASSCEDLMESKVAIWICGHAHKAMEWVAPSGTRCVMNARGYPDQVIAGGYSPRRTVTVTLTPAPI